MLAENADYIEPRVRGALASGESSRERIAHYLQARIDIFWEKPGFYRVLFVDVMGGMLGASPGISPELRARYQAFLLSMAEEFERGMRAGELQPTDPLLLAHLLEGHVRGYLTFLSRDLAGPRRCEDETAVIESFLKGVLR